MGSLIRLLFVTLSLWAISPLLCAADALIAVAANFKPVAEKLVQLHREKTGYEIDIVTGSSGKLFAQITQGAPFSIFLSADQDLPHRLIEQKIAISGSQFTYAKGELVVISQDKSRPPNAKTLLRADNVAIANPKHAPYGKASMQVLKYLNALTPLKGRLVVAENVAQVFQYVHSGSVKMGFVPYSLVLSEPALRTASIWHIDQAIYSPILQDAVLLKHNKAAQSFFAFLQSATAKGLIQSMGYQ